MAKKAKRTTFTGKAKGTSKPKKPRKAGGGGNAWRRYVSANSTLPD